jgi:solute carrier family 25 (adenine nucleotide translocator) protein 4/5/6/31
MKQKYKSGREFFRLIVQQEGISALFRGTLSNVLRGVSGAIVLAGFDVLHDQYVALNAH